MPVIPALWEAEEGGSPEVRKSSPAWATLQNPVSTKTSKISRAWRHRPVIPATQETETGESHKPGRQRFQSANIHHCTSAWATERDSILNTTTKKTKAECDGTSPHRIHRVEKY
uniref:Uncharacterized protein n=1 Tax=Macaca fascicularis TaxID=9541 RepID=A0A7N9CRK0_MACFA